MVREFLGNLRGPQGAPGTDGADGRDGTDGQRGPQGPPGEDGLFTGRVDDKNLFDMYRSEGNGGLGSYTYDDVNGVLNFTNISTRFNMFFTKPENVDTLYLSVYDYDVSVNNGLLRYRLETIDGSVTTGYNNINKNEVVPVDVSGFDGTVVMAFHTGVNGSIEKPMLTQGENPILWNTQSSISTKKYAEGRFYKSDLSDDFTVFGFEHSGGFGISSGKVIMPTGRFLFVQNTYILGGDPETDLFLTLNRNGARVGYYKGNASHSGTLTAVLDTEQGDELELTTSYSAGGYFPPDTRNGFTITEL